VKVPENAFETYVAMGPERSYQALAEKLGVDKRTIVRLATKERWMERLAKIQEDARAATDKNLVIQLQEVRERQLEEARALRGLAVRAMRDLPTDKALKAAAAAFSIAWKQELLILGEPTDRHASTIEEVTKREIQTLLKRDDEPDSWDEMDELEDDADAPG
jgi:transcriptional regulator with XRE-family HTH domain